MLSHRRAPHRLGALERDAEGRYSIGLRLWEIASFAPRSVGLQRLARPYMQDLYETTGYACHLAIREGLELVSIERFQSPRRRVRRPLVGSRYPLHATAIGLVLLAHAPAEVQDEVLERGLEPFTTRTYTDVETLRRVLVDVERAGYAVSDRQVDEVHVGFAAPVRGADGSVVAAVSLALDEQGADPKNLIHLVRLTATSIGRALASSGFGRAES
ncbi:IclR family transcriptional regulator [Microbacterium elymi]|uniref:IclR family transcriptional regulator n=1 Tax=Microbacterium elymi TaxID=2909587 RepID=A0ABY5NHK5_9MICO|nr:IclR family transcriptional regulator [Microbacterium elymi]UUT34589.1 IclR family transcriptional regulator [Microbacterium elymi]